MRVPASLPLPRGSQHPLQTMLLIGCVFGTLLAGALVAVSPALGTAAAAAALFGPIALIDLPLALATFTATLFLRLVPGVGLGSNMIAFVVVIAWAGVAAGRAGAVRAALARMRGVAIAVLLVLLWLTATLAWAEQPAEVMGELVYWWLSALLFVIVGTSLDSERGVRLVAGAFVVAGVLSVIYGIISGDLTHSTTTLETVADDDGRFGGVADPNELAAGLVPAIALCVALIPGMRHGPLRLASLFAVVLLVVGVAATQSRGGILAAGACVVVTLIVAKRRRLQALALTLGVLVVGAFALATTPGALERVTNYDNGGNGRSDLWTVAGRMFADHPAIGVGLNNFRVESPDYVNRPGNLRDVELIVDQPKIVHNTYLQLLAEAGLIGLVLFVVALVLCTAAWRAARRFDAAGQLSLAALSQGVIVAQIGIYVAIFFLSVGDDLRLWLLLGLGPALLAVASTTTPTLSGRMAR